MLTHLEFAFNSYVQSSTKISPFELDGGQQPYVPIDLLQLKGDIEVGKLEQEATLPMVEEFLTRLRANIRFAQEQLKDAQDVQKAYADKRRRQESFAVGDKVYVTTKNFTTERPSRKLDLQMAGLSNQALASD